MEAVFADIQRGAHPLMRDYAVFSADEYGMYVEYFSPSKPLIIGGTLYPGEHPRSSKCYYQLFYVEEYSSYTALQQNYMRMVRCGVPNYLDYPWLSHEDPLSRENIIWTCDSCSKRFGRPEPTSVVPPSYHCQSCDDNYDVCADCYDRYIHERTCRKCNGDLSLEYFEDET